MKKPTYSTLLSAATAGYAVYALVRPRHLGQALSGNPARQADYDVVARLFGPRDLAVSALAILSPTTAGREQAMIARVVLDLTDAALLTPEASSTAGKAKVLGATLTWAALNVGAVIADRKA